MTQRLWISADTHFGHRRIPIYCNRRFCLTDEECAILDKIYAKELPERGPGAWAPSREAIEEHDTYLIDQINRYVQPNDIFWLVGDFCFARKGQVRETAQRYRDRIRCRNVNFVWGNHDDDELWAVFPNTEVLYVKGKKHRIPERDTIYWNNQGIILDHYAMAVWNKSHHGLWQCYGHSHSSAENRLNEFMPGRRSIDVGVDNAYKILGEYRPFEFQDLYDIFSKRDGASIDHHKESAGEQDG